jgi:hypothetical protein
MRYTLLFILCTYPLIFFAQANEKNKTFIGTAFIGINACQIDGDNRAGYNKLGLNIGPAVGFRIKKQIYFNFELLYSQKGSRWIPDQNLYPNKGYKVNLNYIEIPVYLSYNDKKNMNFGLGLSYSSLFKAKELIDYLENQNAENTFSKTDLCWLADVKYQFLDNLGVNLRFSYSLKPIRSQGTVVLKGSTIPSSNIYFRSAQYNNYITVRCCYTF